MRFFGGGRPPDQWVQGRIEMRRGNQSFTIEGVILISEAGDLRWGT